MFSQNLYVKYIDHFVFISIIIVGIYVSNFFNKYLF